MCCSPASRRRRGAGDPSRRRARLLRRGPPRPGPACVVAPSGHGVVRVLWALPQRSAPLWWHQLRTRSVPTLVHVGTGEPSPGAEMSALVLEPVAPDGTAPDEPFAPPSPSGGGTERAVTSLIIVAPLIGCAYAIYRWWGEGIGVRDVVLAAVFYVIIGHGITVGFHRLMTHRSFTARRPLKIALAIVGSMAFQGGPIGWVADHRRHHAKADQPGDPHSPHGHGRGIGGQLRGLWHAHAGWLLNHTPTSWRRYASDLLRDRDLLWINRLFPVWCAVSLALPFGLGYVF